MTNRSWILVVPVVLCLAAPLAAADPFSKGTWAPGLGFGYSSTGVAHGFFKLGYFIVDDLELGGWVEYTHHPDTLDWGMAGPRARLYLPIFSSVIPNVGAHVGRVFLEDEEGGWVVGGAAGVLLMLGGSMGLDVSYQYDRWYVDALEEDETYHLVIGLAAFWG